MPEPPHLADTNILLRLSKQNDPRYPLIRATVLDLRERGATLCYTSQTIAEFWNVSTRPIEKNGFGLSIDDTDARVREIENQFTLLTDSEAVHREWRRLVVRHEVRGAKVHDARLVATMLTHDVRNLLTFNGEDFRRFSEVTVVTPKFLTNA